MDHPSPAMKESVCQCINNEGIGSSLPSLWWKKRRWNFLMWQTSSSLGLNFHNRRLVWLPFNFLKAFLSNHIVLLQYQPSLQLASQNSIQLKLRFLSLAKARCFNNCAVSLHRQQFLELDTFLTLLALSWICISKTRLFSSRLSSAFKDSSCFNNSFCLPLLTFRLTSMLLKRDSHFPVAASYVLICSATLNSTKKQLNIFHQLVAMLNEAQKQKNGRS